MLAAHGPMIQRRLAAMLGIEAATLTRQLERLERDGLVARERAAGDHRAVLVRLTDQGRSLLQRLDGVMAAADAELCEAADRRAGLPAQRPARPADRPQPRLRAAGRNLPC